MKDNVRKFQYGYSTFYDMVVPEPGFYRFEYDIIDNEGNELFPDFVEPGDVHDATALAPVSITMHNIPEILPK